MIGRALFTVFLVCYVAIIIPFTAYLKNRPTVIKLGYTPQAEVLKMVAGDHRALLAELCVLKVLFYFGSLPDKASYVAAIKPEYYNMFKTLETAVLLDPYNSDAYYFAQAAFTWEVGRAADVNRLLIYGMKYRNEDWTLPYFVGFNDAYFLKDYEGAARYFKKAADLSHIELLTNLAARYFYESGKTDLGIIFLDSMTKNTKDKKIRKIYEIRKSALVAVRKVSDAVGRFRSSRGRLPASLDELVSAGFLHNIPADPYGGQFYLDRDGMVRTTSKFAFGSKTK